MNEYQYQITSDQMEASYRHLHHADALRFLERARLDYLRGINFANETLIAQNLFLVITDLSVRYKRELTEGTIFVRCNSMSVRSRLIIAEQEILNDQRKVAVSAVVTSCFMSGDSRRIVLPPESFIRAVGAM